MPCWKQSSYTTNAGRRFQMFEKDLPGGNTTGFGGASASALPLETCETINNSWGFNITDTTYKTTKQLVDYLARASGFGANFLLNIGPCPMAKFNRNLKSALHTWATGCILTAAVFTTQKAVI